MTFKETCWSSQVTLKSQKLAKVLGQKVCFKLNFFFVTLFTLLHDNKALFANIKNTPFDVCTYELNKIHTNDFV